MLEGLIFLGFGVLFSLGYATRSYVGASAPAALVAWAAIVYLQNTPTDDEIGVLYTILLAASVIGVLAYLGGVVFGRRRRRQSSDRG